MRVADEPQCLGWRSLSESDRFCGCVMVDVEGGALGKKSFSKKRGWL